jgi:hypothetical protein
MKDFVFHEEALALKELGFDEPCFGYYDSKSTLTISTNKTVVKDWVWIDNSLVPINMTLAPTFSQAFRFFREKYDLFISIMHYENGYSINDLRRFDTHEEAELACLKKLIEIVKQKR